MKRSIFSCSIRHWPIIYIRFYPAENRTCCDIGSSRTIAVTVSHLGISPTYSATNSSRGCVDAFRPKYARVFLSRPPDYILPFRARVLFGAFFFYFRYYTTKIDRLSLRPDNVNNWLKIVRTLLAAAVTVKLAYYVFDAENFL